MEENIPTQLTEDQKLTILNLWNKDPNNPPGQKELVEATFGPGFDGRDKRAKLVKAYCATLGFKPRSAFEYVPVKAGELTPEQKEYITNHASTMGPMEMAKELYPEKEITSRGIETRQIVEYLKSLSNVVLFQPLTSTATGDYTPPKNLSQSAARVNKYIQNGIKPEDIEKEPKIKINLNCLVRHCHNPRFQLKMNGLNSEIHRALFEQAYVRFLYDKGEDITEEEIDAYINLCELVVEEQCMVEEIQSLKEAMDEQLKESEGKKLAMTFVENIDNIRDKLNQNRKMQNTLRSDLQGKRSERIDTKIRETASVIQLVEAWRSEEKRELLLKLAEKQKLAVKGEIQKQETFDDIISQIYGLDKIAFE